MKICIYGAGAIGGYMGVQLARAGAEVSLVARRPAQAVDRVWKEPVGAIAALGEPHRFARRIVGAVEKRREPDSVGPGEMPVLHEALLVKGQLEAGKFRRRQRGHGMGVLTQDRGRGGADGDAFAHGCQP